MGRIELSRIFSYVYDRNPRFPTRKTMLGVYFENHPLFRQVDILRSQYNYRSPEGYTNTFFLLHVLSDNRLLSIRWTGEKRFNPDDIRKSLLVKLKLSLSSSHFSPHTHGNLEKVPLKLTRDQLTRLYDYIKLKTMMLRSYTVQRGNQGKIVSPHSHIVIDDDYYTIYVQLGIITAMIQKQKGVPDIVNSNSFIPAIKKLINLENIGNLMRAKIGIATVTYNRVTGELFKNYNRVTALVPARFENYQGRTTPGLYINWAVESSGRRILADTPLFIPIEERASLIYAMNILASAFLVGTIVLRETTPRGDKIILSTTKQIIEKVKSKLLEASSKLGMKFDEPVNIYDAIEKLKESVLYRDKETGRIYLLSLDRLFGLSGSYYKNHYQLENILSTNKAGVCEHIPNIKTTKSVMPSTRFAEILEEFANGKISLIG